MLLILVEHYLDKSGKEYFDKWINEVRIILNKFKGFQSIEKLEDVEDKERSLLLLKFENIELLREWSNSEEHNNMIKLLEKHMIKKQKSQILRKL